MIQGAEPAVIMPGETGTTLTITPVLEPDTTFDYFCLGSNECFDGISTDTVSLDMYPQIQIMDSITSDTNNVCYTYPSYIELTVYGGEGDTIRWFSGSCDGTEIATTIDTTLDIVVPSETTTYYARWENSCGISACDSITITVAQDPVIMDTLYFEDNYICYNAYDSILLTAVGGNGDSIRWFDSYNCNGIPFAVTADTFVYVTEIPVNSTTYAAQYVNACGESDCLTVNLYIDDLTYIVDQTEVIEVCEESSTLMYVEAGGTEPFNYQWFHNGAELAGEINDTLYVGPVTFADTGQYYCQVWTDCDTAVSDSIPLIMLELPYFTQQPRDTAVCEGSRDTIQIKVAGDMPILVQWYKNGAEIGGSSLLDTLLILDPVYETADYFAMISNGCGIAFSDTITHRAFDTLVITQQPQYQNLCLLDTAEFVVTAEATEFVTYAWYKLGEPASIGNDSLLRIPNLDYIDQGMYFCIISDTCGEISSDTAMLNMNTPPQVITDPFGATVCEGTFFQFEAVFNADADSLTYQWNYNGGWLPNTDTNILVFDPIERGDEGTYYIRAFNNCGEDESVPVQLNVDYLPDLLQNVSVNPDTVCPDNDFNIITLTASGDGGGFGDYVEWYQGQVGSAFVIGTGQSITLPVPTVTTEYFARWVNSCSDEDATSGSIPGGGSHEVLSTIVTYQDYPLPPSNLSVNVNDFCITYGDSIILSGQGGYGDILEWYLMPNQTYIGQGLSLTVPQPLDTTVYAARWSNHCGVSDSVTIQVNVVPLPEAIIIETDTICAGQPYQIQNVFVNHYDSLRWTSSHPAGTFDTATIQYPLYSNEAIELYDTVVQYLYLTAFGKADCEDAYDTIRLVTTPLPVLAITPESPAICRDSVVTITATGAAEYFWQEIGGSSEILENNPVSMSPVESTEFYLTGIDTRGCIDSIRFSVDVYPTPLVDLGDSVFLFSCEPVQLDAGGGDGSEYYIWSNGYRTRSITVYETGNYSVIVGNPGCEVSDSGYISLCNGRIYMPSAFTPNEDGINETFKPITADPSVEFHMTIFDRWGQMIFETYDIHEGWDGNFNGEACPAGNYVWRIDYQGQGTSSPGKKGSDVGTVMLVR
jgi:gliding motility-associated-like protein